MKVLGLDTITQPVFLDIRLSDNNGRQLAQNFYWLSDKPDVFDWEKTTWAYTPMKKFADFPGLNSLAKTEISASYSTKNMGNDLVLS